MSKKTAAKPATMSLQEVAALVGRSPGTVRNWRNKPLGPRGPRWIEPATCSAPVRYLRVEVEAYWANPRRYDMAVWGRK